MKRFIFILLFVPFICSAQHFGYNGLCTQTNTWKTACTNYPAPLTVYGINQVIETALNDSTWNILDYLQIYAQDDSTNSLRDIVAPTTYIAMTYKKPTWTKYQGWNGNASTSYVDTKYNPHAGTNYTINNATFGIATVTSSAGSSTGCGAYGSGCYTIIVEYTGTGLMYSFFNSVTQLNAENVSGSKGISICTKKTQSTAWEYRNKIGWYFTSGVSTNAIPNSTFFMGACNNNGSGPTAANTDIMSISFAGSYLTPTMEAHLSDNLNKYMAEVGNPLY